MMKYLLISTILLLSSFAKADLCNPIWWQRDATWQQVKAIIEARNFNPDIICNDNGDRPVHAALKIPSPMSIETYYAIGTFVETVPFITNSSFLLTENYLGETSFDLVRVRFQDMVDRIDQYLNEHSQNNDENNLLANAERENPEYRLYTSIMRPFFSSNDLIDAIILLDLSKIDPMFLDLIDSITTRGLQL